MPDTTVRCPHCGQEFALNEAVARDIEKRLSAEYNKKYRTIMDAKEREYEEKLTSERSRLKEEARVKAEETQASLLKDLRTEVAEQRSALERSHQQELELRKKQREMEDHERNLQIEMARTLDSERKKIWDEASTRAMEDQRLRVAEKDKQLSDAQKQVEELRRKLELTSQQAQGEVQEIELETILRRQFRMDEVEPVAKGMRGADILQHVRDDSGRSCGTIIWESKRTKAWGGDWIQKLKDDQRAARADIAVIVSAVLPKEISRIGLLEGVWVVDIGSAVGLAMALRFNLIQVAYARAALESTNDKKELIYHYLTGPGFQQRIEAMVETFNSMRNDLESEKHAMERLWAKRETQIRRVMQNTAGLHGDLEGIIGTALPEVRTLSLPQGDEG
jgi:hypothetical protein